MSSNPLYRPDKSLSGAGPWRDQAPPAYAEVDELPDGDNYAAIDVNPNTRHATLDPQGYQVPSASLLLALTQDEYLAPQPIDGAEYELPTGFGPDGTYEYADVPVQDVTYAEASIGGPVASRTLSLATAGDSEYALAAAGDSEYAEPDDGPMAAGAPYEDEEAAHGQIMLLSKGESVFISALSPHESPVMTFLFLIPAHGNVCQVPTKRPLLLLPLPALGYMPSIVNKRSKP